MLRPKLAIISAIARADFCDPLRWLDQFEVWHFYGMLAPDIRTDQLSGHGVMFGNICELLLGLLRVKPDIIQGSEPYDFPQGFKLSCVAMVAAGLLRRPFYFPTLENLRPESKYHRIRGIAIGRVLAPILRRFLALYSRKSAAVFALNEGAVNNLVAVRTPLAKIRRELYATWGVDLRLFSPTGPCASTIRRGDSILFVGRMVEEKGIRPLLRAFLLISGHVPDASLYFVGDGPLSGEVANFANEHNLRGRIVLLGPVLNSRLPPYFRAARVVAAPSLATEKWAEQVGMVSIQSIACGTPVVTTHSGSIPEFIEDGLSGILVPEDDPKALADALLKLLGQNQFRQSLVESGRACAERRYNAAANVAEVQAILLGLLPRPSRKPAMQNVGCAPAAANVRRQRR